MNSPHDEKVLSSTSVKFDNRELKIEKLTNNTGNEKIRISSLKNGKIAGGPLDLSEGQLLELLNQAIHVGVLPRDFIGKLRERIEI